MRGFLIVLFISLAAFGQNPSSPAGKWIPNLKFFDEPRYNHFTLQFDGTKLTGKLGDDVFEGTFQNGRIEGTVKPNPGTTIQLHGTLIAGHIEGTARVVEQDLDLKWEPAASRSGPPRTRRTSLSPPSSSISFQTRLIRFCASAPATL